jgi:hypothetical protein
MSKVKPVNDFLVLVPFDKPKKGLRENPFSSLVASNNLGTVKYSSHLDYPEGTQVYFGGQYEKLIVEGAEVIAIRTENIIAKLEE